MHLRLCLVISIDLCPLMRSRLATSRHIWSLLRLLGMNISWLWFVQTSFEGSSEASGNYPAVRTWCPRDSARNFPLPIWEQWVRASMIPIPMFENLNWNFVSCRVQNGCFTLNYCSNVDYFYYGSALRYCSCVIAFYYFSRCVVSWMLIVTSLEHQIPWKQC